MKSFDQMLDEGVRAGMWQAFENNAYENCDGSDDPEDRCPSEGGCVCAYVYWKRLPWWQRIFREPPPRPSCEECQAIVVARMADEIIDNLKLQRREQALKVKS